MQDPQFMEEEQLVQDQLSQRPRILIADDSEFNREYLKAILEDDYEIMEVSDGDRKSVV